MAPEKTFDTPIEREVLVAIRRIIRAVDLYSRQLMDEYQLTGPQLAALREISRIGTPSPGELANSLQVSQPTITGILERLEARGLIVRTRNGQDRRAIDVTITDEGKRLMGEAPSLLQERFCKELAKLQKWEQTMLLANLQRIAAMMEAEDLYAAPLLVSGADRL